MNDGLHVSLGNCSAINLAVTPTNHCTCPCVSSGRSVKKLSIMGTEGTSWNTSLGVVKLDGKIRKNYVALKGPFVVPNIHIGVQQWKFCQPQKTQSKINLNSCGLIPGQVLNSIQGLLQQCTTKKMAAVLDF